VTAFTWQHADRRAIVALVAARVDATRHQREHGGCVVARVGRSRWQREAASSVSQQRSCAFGRRGLAAARRRCARARRFRAARIGAAAAHQRQRACVDAHIRAGGIGVTGVVRVVRDLCAQQVRPAADNSRL
jgi:hypothetical protein